MPEWNSNTRNSIKWGDGGLGFVDPNTQIPTPFTLTGLNATACGGLDPVEDAGVFAGATLGSNSWTGGIFRAHCNDRMDSNNPPYGAVNYYLMREAIEPFHEYDFENSYVGDFNGDGKDDMVLHNRNSLALYASTGSELEMDWIATTKITNWEFKSGDRFYVGDFSGDGMDDLFVVNHTGWTQGANNPVSVLGMLRSTGSGFLLENRYDDTLPGWDSMKSNDQFFVADIDGDSLEELYVFNGAIGVDWSEAYLQLFSSTGTSIKYIQRYDDTLPDWGSMKSHDQFFVADFDGDADDDLYVFNGHDWDIEHLQMLQSSGTALSNAKRFDDKVPGWQLRRNDQWFVADVNADGKEDLYVYNNADPDIKSHDGLSWSTEYLGMVRSSGSDLEANWHGDWIGNWNLQLNDKFLVANFNGWSWGSGYEYHDLFVYNNNWPVFAMLRSHGGSLQLNSMYPRWIHNHNYNWNGWW